MFKIILIAALSPLFAEVKNVGCSHPQICTIYGSLTSADVNFEVNEVSGDPHQHDFRPNHLKKFLKVDLFIDLQVKGLDPFSSLKAQRKKNKQASYTISMPEKYQVNEWEHFWLSPRALCHVKRKIAEDLFSKALIDCPGTDFELRTKTLAKKLKSRKVVLAHQSLNFYLKELGMKTFSLVRGHHHGVSPGQMKKLESWLSNPEPIIWIKESQMAQTHKYFKQTRPQDKLIKIDTFHLKDQRPLSILNELISELEKL